MRRDDPEALGHMITNIQKKARECESKDEGHGDMPVRLRFMLEVLMAIRNNNVRKVPGVDLEAVDRMRRVAGACIRGQYFVFSCLGQLMDFRLHTFKHVLLVFEFYIIVRVYIYHIFCPHIFAVL